MALSGSTTCVTEWPAPIDRDRPCSCREISFIQEHSLFLSSTSTSAVLIGLISLDLESFNKLGLFPTIAKLTA